MSTVQILLILGIVTTIAYMIAVYFDYDRLLIARLRSTRSLVDNYVKKPHAMSGDGIVSAPARRVVLSISCDNAPLGDRTIRALLDQSVRVDDIAVETRVPQPLVGNDDALKIVVSLHQPGTTVVRERDASAIILPVTNGSFYAYDYVERRARAVAGV
jgi:hypothetical protein